MNQRINKKGSFLVNTLFMFLILCSSNSLITQNQLSIKFTSIVNTILLLILFLIANNSRIILIDSNGKTTIIMVALIFITVVVNLDIVNIGGYLLIVIQILQMLLLVSTFDEETYSLAYINALVHIAVASIIVTYILPIFGLEKVLPTITNINNLKFSWMLFAAKLDASGYFGIRNYGIFSEPAAYCYYLTLAMFFTLRVERQLKKKIVVMMIFSFASFSTMSPVGLIAGISFALMLFFEVFKSGKRTDRILLLLLFVVIMVLISAVAVFNDALYYLLDKTNTTEGSGLGRSESIRQNLLLWLRRPVFGNGLKDIITLTASMGSCTSTTGVSLSCFGFLFSTIVAISQIKTIARMEKGAFLNTILAVLVFFMVINNYGFIQAEWYWLFCFEPYQNNSDGKTKSGICIRGLI